MCIYKGWAKFRTGFLSIHELEYQLATPNTIGIWTGMIGREIYWIEIQTNKKVIHSGLLRVLPP